MSPYFRVPERFQFKSQRTFGRPILATPLCRIGGRTQKSIGTVSSHAEIVLISTLAPRALRLCVSSAAIAQPCVEKGGLLQLQAAHAGYSHKAAIQLRQSGHIAPEFFKLSYREDIF